MERVYRFKTKVESPSIWECCLLLGALGQPYPISSLYLKVPVKSRIEFIEGGERGFDVRKINYLDFENALKANGDIYKEVYLSRPKQRAVLFEVEREAIQHIPQALEGDLESIKKLKNLKIKSDNGLILYNQTLRYGKPKRAGKNVTTRNNKILSN